VRKGFGGGSSVVEIIILSICLFLLQPVAKVAILLISIFKAGVFK